MLVGQEKGKETLTNESLKVTEENVLEEIEQSDVSSILPGKFEPFDKTEEFSVESENKPSDGNSSKLEDLEFEAIKFSKSLETEAGKEIYEDILNTSVEKQAAEKTLQDLESGLLNESVNTREELFGPTKEVHDKCERDNTQKELEAHEDSEESLSAQEKPKFSGDSASTTGGNISFEETTEISREQKLIPESSYTSAEKATLDTSRKILELDKEPFAAEVLLEEKSFGGSTNDVEQKETLGEILRTTEDKTVCDVEFNPAEKQVTEVSNTFEVRDLFRESSEKEGEKINQESTQILIEQKRSQGSPLKQYSLETYPEHLKPANKSELPLQECPEVLEDQLKNSKEDKETEVSYKVTKTTEEEAPSGESNHTPEESVSPKTTDETAHANAEGTEQIGYCKGSVEKLSDTELYVLSSNKEDSFEDKKSKLSPNKLTTEESLQQELEPEVQTKLEELSQEKEGLKTELLEGAGQEIPIQITKLEPVVQETELTREVQIQLEQPLEELKQGVVDKFVQEKLPQKELTKEELAQGESVSEESVLETKTPEELTQKEKLQEILGQEELPQEQLVQQLPQEQPILKALPQEQSVQQLPPQEQPFQQVLPQEQLFQHLPLQEQPVQQLLPQEQPVQQVLPQEQPVQQVLPQEQADQQVLPLEQPVQQVLLQEQPGQQVLPQEQPDQQFLPLEQPVHQVLPQEQPVQEVVTKEKLLEKDLSQDHLSQEKLAQKGFSQEELAGEKKTTGDSSEEHKEVIQETPGLECLKTVEEKVLASDTSRTVGSKHSPEEIVKEHFEQNETFNKSVVLEEALHNRDQDFHSCLDSESIKATQTLFLTSDWQIQQELSADKTDIALDETLLSQPEPLSSSTCAGVCGDKREETAEDFLHSDISSNENAIERTIIQKVGLKVSPEEYSLAHSLKHWTTSPEKKETVSDSRSLVDVKEKLTPVDNNVEAGQQLNLEGFSDNFNRLDIISDTERDHSIISDTDKPLDQFFSVLGSAVTDFSVSTAKQTDSTADFYTLQVEKPETDSTAKSCCFDTETDCLATDNHLFEKPEEDPSKFDPDIIYSSVVISEAEFIIEEPKNTQVLGCESVETDCLAADDLFQKPEEDPRKFDPDIIYSSLIEEPVEISKAEFIIEEPKKTEVSHGESLKTDHLAADNWFQKPEEAPRKFDPNIIYSSLNRESVVISEAEFIIEEPKNTEVSYGESVIELQETAERLGEEVAEFPEKNTEILPEKFTRDPAVDTESSPVVNALEKSTEFSDGVSTQVPRKVPEISFEKSSRELLEVKEILAEQGSEEPWKGTEILVEPKSELPQKDQESLIDELSEQIQKSPKITAEDSSQIVLEFSVEDTSQGHQKSKEILVKDSSQHPRVSEISAEENTQEVQKDQSSLAEERNEESEKSQQILAEGSSQEYQKDLEISEEEGSQEPQKGTKILTEDISEEPQKVPVTLAERSSEEPQEGSKIQAEGRIQEALKVFELSNEETSQEPWKVLKIAAEESSQEPHKHPEISVKESSQEPEKVSGNTAEESCQESEIVPEISAEESSQEPQEGPYMIAEENFQEPYKNQDISAEGRSQEPQKVAETSAEEPQEVAEILAEERSQEPQKVAEILAEETSEEAEESTKISGEERSQEPQKVAETSAEEHQEVAEILAENRIQEPQEVAEASAEEPQEVAENLAEESSQEPQTVAESSAESFEEIPKGTKIFDESCLLEIQKDTASDISAQHSALEPVESKWISKEVAVEGSEDKAISSLETELELPQAAEISLEDSIQELDKVLSLESTLEPQKDKVSNQDQSQLLVHQLEMTAPSQTRFLVLNLDENRESEVFRLGKGWTLQFFLGPTLVNSNVRLFVNHPTEEETWDKNSYHELEWYHPSLQLDVCEGHADVTMVRAGSFHYYFTTDGSDSKDRANGRGFFLVDPDLVIGQSQEKLPLDGIICQTVMSKLLGPFPEWKGRLRVAKETGYNVIHFTPLQELGASNSAYALTDLLKLNPVFHTTDRTFDFQDVERLVKVLNDEYNLLSFTDLVLNHLANECPWLYEHPECVYNLVNSPHLKPSYLLDRCLRRFSVDVADGVWENRGIPPTLNSEEHLEKIATVLHTSVLPQLRLSEFYQVSVDEVLSSFRHLIADGISGDHEQESELRIIPDPEYRRLRSTVNLPVAVKFFYSSQTSDLARDEKIQLAVDRLQDELEKLNAQADAEVSEHLLTAVENFVANARYRFVNPNGLRLPAVTREQPIMNRYFVNPYGYLAMEEEETLMHTEKAAYCWAHNGWVAGPYNPLDNFAKSGSNVYLRRELNSWEDSVKLRYGDSPDDCPFLWEKMREYGIRTAQIFHGVRLDNCHNTPIHVAEWVLAEARAVRPNLYVMAELFTHSEHFDNIYINRLGLNSMIREALVAGDARNLGNLLLQCSSEPVGAFFQLPLRPLTSSLIHDVLFDQTHDNESIVERRSVLDVLPHAALVAMANCAVGSTRGYDEVVPHHISVITESRLFRSWNPDKSCDRSKCVELKTGIIAAKRALNRLHWKLTVEGFNEVSVKHLTDDVVAVTRHNAITHESVVLVAHTAFQPHSGTSLIPPLPIEGCVREVILEARVMADASEDFVPNDEHICGLDDIQLIIHENIDISESQLIRLQIRDNLQIVEFVQFPASAVIVLRVSVDDSTDASLSHLRHLLACFGYKMRPQGTDVSDVVSAADGAELEEIFTELTLSDLNRVLFRCDAEERDDGFGYGVYHIPGFGDLPFCGFAGVMSVLMAVRASNDLDHPLCRNLKEGDWMVDYLSGRLLCHHGTKRLGSWLKTQFEHIKNLPRCLIPCYFDAFVTGVYAALEELAWNKMADFVTKGSTFVRALALASLQVCGVSRSSSLPGLSPHLDPPSPAVVVDTEGHPQLQCITIAAGLPHFSSGAFRSWGRDTFISMRGLLLVTGRFEEARFLILAFAGYLRHGLIPNFLGCGSLEPRYNSRDAVWWWLQAIQDYCSLAPHGIAILQDKVSRCYPRDDSSVLPPGACDQLLCDVIQEALQRHSSGVKFRERDAGPKIDNDMTSAGFDIEVGIDWETGFVFGGNEHNCGTWMDKMGSSRAAGNIGKPATPRHGSAVEIVGLCYSAVKWLAVLSQWSLFPYSGVSVLQDGVVTQVSFQCWSDLIAKNFEPKFWIDYDLQNDPHPELVNRRGIYRDVCHCSHTWCEYQLRPNFAIAVALAPELCNVDHAWVALEQAGEVLMGPLGLKTLDPSDWEYSGYYSYSQSSTDYKTACGYSYHQGPEWIWPVGFFLRAIMQVAKRLEAQHAGILRDTLSNVRRILSAHHTFIHASDWKSLPELTNENGELCDSSCPSQAWSIACILDSLYDAEKMLTSISPADHDHSSN